MKRFLASLVGRKSPTVRKPRRARLGLDALEDRRVPVNLAVLVLGDQPVIPPPDVPEAYPARSQFWVYNGDMISWMNPTVSHSVDVRFDGEKYTITDQTPNYVGTLTFLATELGPEGSLSFGLGGQNDDVRVWQTKHEVHVDGRSGGTDTVFIGDPVQGLKGIQKPIQFDGTAWGQDRVVIDDQGSLSSNTYDAENATFLSFVSRNGNLLLQGTHVAELSVRGGQGNEEFRIHESAAAAGLTLHGGGGHDRLTLEQTGNGATRSPTSLIVNAAELTVPDLGAIKYTGLEDVVLNMVPLGTSVWVQSTAAGTPVTLNARTGPASGNDTIRVHSADGRLDGIRGPVTINGGGGSDHLILSDAGSASGRFYTVTDPSVTRSDLAPVSYSNLARLTLDVGGSHDTIVVSGTRAGTPLTLNAGEGHDTILVGDHVRTIAAPVTVNGGGGYDTVHLYDLDTGEAAVAVDGGGDIDWLVLDDQADTAGHSYTFSAGVVSRSGSSPVATYAGAEHLYVFAGSGADTFLIPSTAAVPSFFLDGGGGADALTVDETGVTWPHSAFAYAITATTISKPTGETIDYAGLEDLTLTGGPGSHTITVLGTAAGTATRVFAGSGASPIRVGDGGRLDGIDGPLTIDDKWGNDYVYIYDQANPDASTYTFTAGRLERDGVAPISYQGVKGVQLQAGQAGDQIFVWGTPSGTALKVFGGEGGDTFVPVATDLPSHTKNAIQGEVAFYGQGGYDVAGLMDWGTDAWDYTIDGGVVSRHNLAPVRFDGDIEYVQVYTGSGDDTFEINHALPGQFVYLNAGAGADRFRPTPAAGALAGPVFVEGASGIDRLDYAPWGAGVTANLTLHTATGLVAVWGVEDVLGGRGNDTLVGDDAANRLTGNGGHDVLIGGRGADSLNGGSGDDLLIAGSTYWDLDATALAAIQAEWTRADVGYSTKREHFTGNPIGSLNGSYLLNRYTVYDDGAADRLTGSFGLDWSIARTSGGAPDLVTDPVPEEAIDQI